MHDEPRPLTSCYRLSAEPQTEHPDSTRTSRVLRVASHRRFRASAPYNLSSNEYHNMPATRPGQRR
jgi:hypothetical protein